MKSLLSFNFSFFLLLLIPFNWTIAQSQPENPTLYPIEENELYGFINPKGEKVIPPSFHAVGLFSEGLAAARKEGLYGFIDETGSYVILPKYDYARKFEDGMAMVWLGSKPYFIDRDGRILFEYVPKEEKRVRKTYPYEEPKKLILFAKNRFFQHLKDDPNGEDWKRSWRLTDESGKILCKAKFEEVLEIGLQNGVAFVKRKDRWGVIDVNGKFVFRPQFYYLDKKSVREGIFFYNKRVKVKFQDRTYKRGMWGVANLKGEILAEPKFGGLNWVDTSHQIIFGGGIEKNFYMDSKCNSIWEHSRNWKFPAPIVKNVDYMSVSHCFLHIEEEDNPKEALQFSYDDMTLEVQSSSLAENPILYVINQSEKTVAIEYKYSIANLKIQAKDKDGVWKDIEYLPMPDCGNGRSAGYANLGPNRYWDFELPNYQGEFDTYLRVVLEYFPDREKGYGEEKLVIYSNIFKGGVNPGQFWRKYEYGGGYSLSGLVKDWE